VFGDGKVSFLPQQRTFHSRPFCELSARQIALDGVSLHEQVRWLDTARVSFLAILFDLLVLSLQSVIGPFAVAFQFDHHIARDCAESTPRLSPSRFHET
jgi:hypothetical protein